MCTLLAQVSNCLWIIFLTSTPSAARVVKCRELENPRFGSVVLSGRTVGSTAAYSCEKGYELVGQSVRVCQPDGDWSREAPICKCKNLFHMDINTFIISPMIPLCAATTDCGRLSNPKNGRVQFSGTSLGSFAKYTCNRGHVRVGNKFRKCLTTGWSGSEPVCKREHWCDA